MDVRALQALSLEVHNAKGWTDDLPKLGLGLCEEAGEVAKAINLLNPHYIPTPGRVADDLPHEIGDLLVYLFAIANSAHIDIQDVIERKIVAQAERLGVYGSQGPASNAPGSGSSHSR